MRPYHLTGEVTPTPPPHTTTWMGAMSTMDLKGEAYGTAFATF